MLPIDEREYTPQISNYRYWQVTPYNQYQQIDGVDEFFEEVNKHVKQHVNQFLNELAECINLRAALSESDSFDKSYAEYYLLNYFGLQKIPDPSAQKSQTINVYDMPDVQYDSMKFWDILISNEESETASSITSKEWAQIAIARLDYQLPALSLDFVTQLLKQFFYANTGQRSLDLTAVRWMIDKELNATVCLLPAFYDEALDINTGDIWKRFVLIAEYNPSLLGLPFGRVILFQTYDAAESPIEPEPDDPIVDPQPPVDPEEPKPPVDPEEPKPPVDPEEPKPPVDPEEPEDPIDPTRPTFLLYNSETEEFDIRSEDIFFDDPAATEEGQFKLVFGEGRSERDFIFIYNGTQYTLTNLESSGFLKIVAQDAESITYSTLIQGEAYFQIMDLKMNVNVSIYFDVVLPNLPDYLFKVRAAERESESSLYPAAGSYIEIYWILPFYGNVDEPDFDVDPQGLTRQENKIRLVPKVKEFDIEQVEVIHGTLPNYRGYYPTFSVENRDQENKTLDICLRNINVKSAGLCFVFYGSLEIQFKYKNYITRQYKGKCVTQFFRTVDPDPRTPIPLKNGDVVHIKFETYRSWLGVASIKKDDGVRMEGGMTSSGLEGSFNVRKFDDGEAEFIFGVELSFMHWRFPDPPSEEGSDDD